MFDGERRRPRGRLLVGAVASLLATIGVRGAGATTLGPVFELPTHPAAQRAPAVSWDASQQVYLLVWQDERNAATAASDIFLARVSSDGALLDASGHPLLEGLDAGAQEYAPSVVYSSSAQAHIVAWTRTAPGAGTHTAYMARVFAQASLASPIVVPSGGRTLTEADGVSLDLSVAVASQTALFLYRDSGPTGGDQLRGRRVYLDGTVLDGQPFAVSLGPGRRPVALGLGSSFLVAYQDAGDISARVIPGVGLVPAPTIGNTIPVSSSTYAASWVELGRNGPGVHAVWEEQRSPPLSADLYGRALTTSGALAGPVLPVLTSTGSQRQPLIAGDTTTGALAVWYGTQPLRPIPTVFGTPLDPTTGGVRREGGFPVFDFGARPALTPALTKGPGGDFLVAAVRFDTQTPRIFYRVVRDELPAGLLRTAGTSTVPVGGPFVPVRFDDAVGASGFEVVDGTLFTVSLSRSNVLIGAADVAPDIPGHQVPSRNGEVIVPLRSSVLGPVDVTLASVEGTSTGSISVDFVNTPPTARRLRLSPSAPASNQPLAVLYTFEDMNRDAEDTSQRSIRWTRDDQPQPAYDDLQPLPASATMKGERWSATVRVFDGVTLGPPTTSGAVEIQNARPSVSAVFVSPEGGTPFAVTGASLSGSYQFTDPDGDMESGTELRWYLDGEEQEDLRDQETVAGERVVKGQRWAFSVRPRDDDPSAAFGLWVRSATVTVENSAPEAAVQMMPGEVMEGGEYVLDGSASFDIDPEDELSFDWRQVPGEGVPTVSLVGADAVTCRFTAPSVRSTALLRFELVVGDGEASSSPQRFSVRVVANADSDGDRLDDEEERALGTNPNAPDTDLDGLTDGEEVLGLVVEGDLVPLDTDPLDADSDDDGVWDGQEGRSSRDGVDFDPAGDPDGDGLINALDPDSDDDGLSDGTELSRETGVLGGRSAGFEFAGTDVEAGNFTADAEPRSSTNPVRADTDGDGRDDGVEDENRDGAIDRGESDPNNPEDPRQPCIGDVNACPGELSCIDGVCLLAEVDSGAFCSLELPAEFVCCAGGCEGGVRVDAVCRSAGARKTCGPDAARCEVGACDAPVEPPPPTSSGGCAVTGAQPALGWMLLLGCALGWRRRSSG